MIRSTPLQGKFMKTKPTLTDFYNFMWNELHVPPEESKIPRFCGLCSNIELYADTLAEEFGLKLKHKLEEKLKNQLEKTFDNSLLPFNKTYTDYVNEKDKYKNYKRLYWIYTHTRGIPMREYGAVFAYDIPPQVAKLGNLFCIIGTAYEHVHRADGTIRTWQTKSGAMKFLKAYCYSQQELKNV